MSLRRTVPSSQGKKAQGVHAPCVNRLQQVLDIGKGNEDVINQLQYDPYLPITAEETTRKQQVRVWDRRMLRELTTVQGHFNTTQQLLNRLPSESDVQLESQEELEKRALFYLDLCKKHFNNYKSIRRDQTYTVAVYNNFANGVDVWDALYDTAMRTCRAYLRKAQTSIALKKITDMLQTFKDIELPSGYPDAYGTELEGIVQRLNNAPMPKTTEVDLTKELIHAYIDHKKAALERLLELGTITRRQIQTMYGPFSTQPKEVTKRTEMITFRSRRTRVPTRI